MTKSKSVITALALMGLVGFSSMSQAYGWGGGWRGGYRGGYSNSWIAPAVIGAAIAAPIIYSNYYRPPVYIQQPVYVPTQVYVQQGQPYQTALFCQSYNAFYPQVQSCPEQWMPVQR